MSVTGHPNSEPTRVGTSIGDITAGLFTAIGINAALYDRQKTGKGMFIDVSMLDCQIAILENAIGSCAFLYFLFFSLFSLKFLMSMSFIFQQFLQSPLPGS